MAHDKYASFSLAHVWHGCKQNFAGPQIYLKSAKIESEHVGVSLNCCVGFENIADEDLCVKIFISSVFASDNQYPKIFWTT